LRVTSLLVLLLVAGPARAADDPIRIRAQAIFFGDNTELANPFRDGETILGASARVFVTLPVSDRAEIRAGVFARQRFGGENAFDLVRPVFALAIGTPRHRFIFGTLDTTRHLSIGPDRQASHGLLPPIQDERVVFTRGHEAGIQWIADTPRLQQDLWLNWHLLNTPAQREEFDAGAATRVRVRKWISLGTQLHVVHRGGQLFRAGPVTNSLVYGPGAILGRGIGAERRLTFEAWGLASHHQPDREQARRTNGKGMFLRAVIETSRWRGHLLVWRAWDFIKDEGDPNYSDLMMDGERWRKVRDYSELGAARSFPLGSRGRFEASLRFHRVESHYAYSYRLLGVVDFEEVLRKLR